MEEYSPEVQKTIDEISAQLVESLKDVEYQTLEEQTEIIKKYLMGLLTDNDVPNEVKVTASGKDKVAIEISVPIEWSWLFDECEEDSEEPG